MSLHCLLGDSINMYMVIQQGKDNFLMKGSAVVVYSTTKVLVYILSQGVEVYTLQQPVLMIKSC